MASDTSERDLLLTRLADEFAERYRRGERPTLREYAEKYPVLADDIRDLFPAMVEMEQAKDHRQDLTPPAAAPPPLQQLGDFRILREIGRGGMGVVYEAEQISLGRHVALKVLPSNDLLDGTQKRRFEREAKAAAKLHHTNIVPVFAVGEHEGLPYYAMQFIQGVGLDLVVEELQRLQPGGRSERGAAGRGSRPDVSAAQVVQSLLTGEFEATADLAEARSGAMALPTHQAESPGEAPKANATGNGPPAGARADTALASGLAPLSSSSVILPGQGSADPSSRSGKTTYWKSVAQVGIQVAEALAYAHDQGILHRDIKPSNLLLDTHGTVWITDFGLAKTEDHENLTHRGEIIGTLRYMPPEAFDGKNEPRSDLYSLGLTLYEMLALRPAFEGHDRNQLIRQVTCDAPTPLERLNRSIPRDLVTIVHKAMDRDPTHRYATAGELAADLRRFCADESILARRPSGLEHLLRWARHHPGLAAALVAIALLLTSVTVVAVVAAENFRTMAAENLKLAQQREEQRLQAENAREEARRQEEAERWERYRANIAAAVSALRLHNAHTARLALLDAPEKHRNWEWQHLHNQLDGARAAFGRGSSEFSGRAGTLLAAYDARDRTVHLWDVVKAQETVPVRGHQGLLGVLALSPDGLRLACTSEDHAIHLWDAATGEDIAVLHGHKDKVEWLLFSPDGRRLFSRSDTTLCLWDAATGNQIAVLGENANSGTNAAFSPDGRKLALYWGDTLYLVDAATGKRLHVLGSLKGGIYHLVFSPDGHRIVANGTHQYEVHLWDSETGKEIAVLRGHTQDVRGLVFSPDGSRLATTGEYPENSVRLWDARTGRPLAVLLGHKNAMDNLVFSPDGTRLVSASMDQTARLWDAVKGHEIAVLRGHTGALSAACFSADGKRIVTCSADHTVRLWNGHSGEPITVLLGHDTPIRCAAYLDGGSLLLSRSDDGELRVWDLALAEQHGILRGHDTFVYDVAFHPDGMQVASAGWDGSVRLWDLQTGQQTGLLLHDVEIVGAVAWHPDGKQLVAVSRDDRILLWDVARGKRRLVLSAATGHWTGDPRAVFSPDGNWLVAGGSDGHLRLWEVATGKLAAVWPGEQGLVRDVAFHPDGKLLASAGFDGTVRIWDVATRSPVAVLHGHKAMAYRLAYSADGAQLASASHDGTVRLWDTQTHEQLAILPHGGKVHGVAFHPNGTRLATACADNTIRLWDLATRKEVAELHGHTDYVHAIAWSPDGTRLASASGDHTLRVWDSLAAAQRARVKPPTSGSSRK